MADTSRRPGLDGGPLALAAGLLRRLCLPPGSPGWALCVLAPAWGAWAQLAQGPRPVAALRVRSHGELEPPRTPRPCEWKGRFPSQCCTALALGLAL